MRLPRRRFLQLAAGAAAAPFVPRIAAAQPYPARPVRIIVTTAPALAPDIVARLIAQQLAERFGRQFVVENRPGGGQNVGTELAVKAVPDGHTLLLATAANAINATLYNNLNYNFIHDFVPVAGIARVPMVMVVHPSVPATTIPEFIAYAKANPGKINLGSGGNGSPPHIAGELFKMMTGVDMLHVPYANSNALPDLLAGQVQVYFGPITSSLGYIQSGKLRALAVTGVAPAAALPGVPTMDASVPGYEMTAWYGIMTPRGTPADVVDMLNHAINAALADPSLIGKLADMGAEPMPITPAAFGELIANETLKLGKVIKFASIRVD